MHRLDGWVGAIKPDPAEVHAWRYVALADVQQDMRRHPEHYTPWLRDERHAGYASQS